MVLVKMRETAQQYLNKKIKYVSTLYHMFYPTDYLPVTQLSPSRHTSTMLSAKQQRMLAKLQVSTSYESSMNRLPPPWHTVLIGRIRPSSRSTI
jgi:hypothetical protein